ncbi:transcriptional regulator [Amylibacter ulvae]|uniref:Transcriptional regulator n=1 Tax=Paramylibacter ulvae TaxID=1651968 RepID=A0ABQ3CWI3_9RHOB|nr:ChrR family anti-sigma-E factor [Amylibacter ulvae]GHA44410.1 transcriptional regulator [Amylibacter ulvae]
MTHANHHIPDAMLKAYAAGNISPHFATLVAAHISMCETCRVALGAHEAVGGALLDVTKAVDVSSSLKTDVFSKLDAPFVPKPVFDRSGIYPGPIVQAMKGQEPRWKSLGMGIRQHIISYDKQGSLRLLYIPAGQAVPEHGHNGLELTLVLQGSFSDETGQFGVGDVEVGDEDLAHVPTADAGAPCICLAATDASLRFAGLIPRMLQPIFKI